MDPGLRERLSTWLADPQVTRQDPETTASLLNAVAAADDRVWRVSVGAHGTVACSMRAAPGGAPLPVLEFDRHGTLLTVARWAEAGLGWAKLRLPDGRWVGIEPHSMASPLWGESDRLWLRADGAPFSPTEELSHFQAADYRAVAAIPALAEPRRLPPGAGTAVLNFLARLLVEQGTPRVFYQGPYATEQLFTALLESFRYDATATDPLGQFQELALGWTPAPHERRFLQEGIYVQLRDGVEKAVFRGRAYYRRQWQSVIRSEPHVVREAESRVICSLWALGLPVEDHLVLDAGGDLVEILEAHAESGHTEPLAPAWRGALAALLGHQSAPALRPWLGEALQALDLTWGPVAGDLLELSGDRAVLSLKLPRLFRRRLAECETRPERLGLALALISDVAGLLGPALRLRAHALLASLPETVQRAALEDPPPALPLTPLEELARLLAAGQECPEDLKDSTAGRPIPGSQARLLGRSE